MSSGRNISGASSNFLCDIERLRGFACILVFIQHIIWIAPYNFLIQLVPGWLSIGSGGVHIFFAISGFAVTYSLFDKFSKLDGGFLENIQQSKEWLVLFYKKRFFRIFPAIFVLMILSAIFLYYTSKDNAWPTQLICCPFEILMGTFNNIVDAFAFDKLIYTSTIGPLWTLAVESQFYMFWPLVLLACKNNNQRAVVSLTLGLLFAFIVHPLNNMFLQNNYYWTANNVSELFLGSFFAFLYKGGFKIEISSCGAKWAAVFFAFAVWFYPSVWADSAKIFCTSIIITFASVMTVAFCAFCNDSFNFPLFGRIFGFLGKRSFSFYIVQLLTAQIVLWFTNSIFFSSSKSQDFGFDTLQFVIFVTALLIMTELMYRFVEIPSRRLHVSNKQEK